ncbi:hypothetical protein AVB60_14640 [Salmonella enterica subsp. enterica serovar Typhimurium]|nr:hypothetical protein [Salmonella enterica subsp. enterica serovar Typhimurium]ECN9100091.1 hypothetical protein [Salmonella enterica subsp. enterica serovar Typhimurium]ECY5268858.1 hypothetical protein [Salmonella enterica subsp. enterica serovar Typhimurium]
MDGVVCHILWFYRGGKEPLPRAGPRQRVLAGSLLRHHKASDGYYGGFQTCQLSLKKENPVSTELAGQYSEEQAD